MQDDDHHFWTTTAGREGHVSARCRHTIGNLESRGYRARFRGVEGRADALFVVLDPLTSNNRLPIATLALGARLPTMQGLRELVEAGGLMSYAANFPDLFRRPVGFVDKILHGVKAAEIPVEQPTKFDLVVNLTTAKTLGWPSPIHF